MRHREEKFVATATNQAWSLDFMADQLQDGRRFRALTIYNVQYSKVWIGMKNEKPISWQSYVVDPEKVILKQIEGEYCGLEGLGR